MDRFKKKTDENGERTSLKIKISMRKTAKMIAVVSCTILMLAACSPKKEVISQSVTGNEDKTYDSGEWIVQKNGSLIQNAGGNQDGEKKRYCFQDVEENRYEAPLLSDVPKCTYDFSDLKTDEQTGYKSYQDPETGAKAKLGIDVSEFQGEVIDWKQVKESGVEFVMVRLGYRAYGESGSLVLDAMYEQNVKNALETAVKNGGVAMTETDTAGHTSASNMEQGLYLIVETRVPENVTSTCNPFFVSLPMTTVVGSEWLYDLTVYPKNQTGNSDLKKTVRESKNSTGKHNGSLTDITDGFEHTATASVGDVVYYQILSTLPTITSKASSLGEYTYVDTMSKGIRYNKQDVVIEFFRDSACTDKITAWAEDSGKFTVTYDDTANTMIIKMTEAGLNEINEAATVYTDSVKRGYSDCTMRITYAAALTADAKMGDTDNPNEVALTWKRTNTTYYDTLEDCCHVYTYGIDVLKQFSDGKGNIQNAKFNLHNDTDNCYIIADLKDGIYYAKGITSKKSDATTFIPNSSGHIVVKGLEDDAYSLTETATGKGYVLLKDAVKIVIKANENGHCEKCGTKLLTVSATVNGKDVTMSDGNAIVPLTVVNNPGFDLPKTGGYGTWMFTIGGVALLGAAAFIVVRSRKHKSEQ